MPENPVTRDDVVIGKTRRFGLPFLMWVKITRISVAGQDCEVLTSTATFRTHLTTVHPARPLVNLPTRDTEEAIAALLEAINTRAAEQS